MALEAQSDAAMRAPAGNGCTTFRAERRTLSSEYTGRARVRWQVEIFPGISMDPAVRFEKPCIIGTRVDVATALDDLAAGESFDVVQEDYQLTRAQVVAALRYAAHLAAHTPPAVSEAS